jgi:hypothetical protein
MLRGLHQPDEHSIRVHRKDAGDSADAESFGECPDGPHQLLGLDVRALQGGAVGLLEIAFAAQTIQLSPVVSTGMAVGAEIPEADPAVIRTDGMRTEVV